MIIHIGRVYSLLLFFNLSFASIALQYRHSTSLGQKRAIMLA